MRVRRLATCQRGVASVEAAILFPILMLAGFGALDAALLVQQTHRMEAGLGAAGSYLAQGEADTVQQRRARRIAVTGQGNTKGTPSIRGWTPKQVTITVEERAGTAGQFRGSGDVRIATLSASMPYTGLGLLSGVTGRTLHVTADYQVRLAR